MVEDQSQLIEALWPVSPLNPLNHFRFVHLLFWRWNQFPNEQARWLQSSFTHYTSSLFTVLPFFCFIASTLLSPLPLHPVTFTDLKVVSSVCYGGGWLLQGEVAFPKWSIVMALEAMGVGFLLELLLGTFYNFRQSPSQAASVIIRGCVVCGSTVMACVMSPLAVTFLCLALSMPGSLALLSGPESEMEMSRQSVPFGLLLGFVLTQSSGVLLGTLVVSFKVLYSSIFSNTYL